MIAQTEDEYERDRRIRQWRQEAEWENALQQAPLIGPIRMIQRHLGYQVQEIETLEARSCSELRAQLDILEIELSKRLNAQKD